MNKRVYKAILCLALAAAAPAASAAAAGAPAAAFDWTCLVYPALSLAFLVLAAADLGLFFSRLGRFAARLFAPRPAAAGGAGGGGAPLVPPEEEVCPNCSQKLVDGECPNGCTIVRCNKCNSILHDGVCPHCGVGAEQEFCPTCDSELVDGECPNGHTIVRCPDCGSILKEGVCPKGCNADPLNLGWPGGVERKLSPYALRVVTCIKSEGAGFELRVPDSFIVGRTSADASEPFVELLTVTRKEKAQCSRQYVRMDLDPAGGGFVVTLLNSSKNPAIVDGEKLVAQNATAKLPLGGSIKLNPGYELQLVEAPAEG